MTDTFTPSRKTGRARGYITAYRPQAKTQQLLADCQQVLDEYREHWPLTVRQIYYRMVGARGYPKTEAFYSTLCHHVANARRAKVIPFDAIRDDGVTTMTFRHFADKDEFQAYIRGQARNYRRDLLASQPYHIEVWCEAAGMLPQLSRVATDYSVSVYSSSGFDSLTAKKDLADRIIDIGKPAYVLHLGDYDPSGAAMFHVIEEDVGAFVAADRLYASIDVKFVRVALTEMQVEEYRLPTAPPKATDSRAKAWKGETCQLEALAPDQIAALLRAELDALFDTETAGFDRILERYEREELTQLLLTGPSEQEGAR